MGWKLQTRCGSEKGEALLKWMKIRISFVFFIVCATILLAFLVQRTSSHEEHKVLYAIEGVLYVDTLCDRRVVALGGEWEFIYGKHVFPHEMEKTEWQRQRELIVVPSVWNNHSYQGQKLQGTGIATYRLQLVLPEKVQGIIALSIPSWDTAYKLYVNGVEVTSAGTLGTTKEDTLPSWAPKAAQIVIEESPLDIVVHMANFSYARGGMSLVPLLGRSEVLQTLRERGVATKLFVFGGIFMISLYHMVIFLLRPRETSPLYFALFCLAMELRTLFTEEQTLLLFAPLISFDLQARLTYLPLAGATLFFILFIRSLFAEEMHPIPTSLFIFLGAFFVGMIVLTPPLVFSSYLNLLQAVGLATAFYAFLVICLAAYRNREGARLFLFGFFIYFGFMINDILHYQKIIVTGYFVPMGSLFFLFIQAIIVSKRYARSLDEVVELSTKNEALAGEALNLQHLSYVDALTGVGNRRRLDTSLEQEWQKAKQKQEEIALILMDIDFFKAYNDQYGHPAGDEVLKIVASTIDACVYKTQGVTARYGGEEFAVLLPNSGANEAWALSEEIRLAILSLGITAANAAASDHLSVSLGYAVMRPRTRDVSLGLVQQADTSLYQAKQKGRNRTEPQA